MKLRNLIPFACVLLAACAVGPDGQPVADPEAIGGIVGQVVTMLTGSSAVGTASDATVVAVAGLFLGKKTKAFLAARKAQKGGA